MRLLLIAFVLVGCAAGQSYCITSSGRILIMPNVGEAPVLLAPIPDRIPEIGELESKWWGDPVPNPEVQRWINGGPCEFPPSWVTPDNAVWTPEGWVHKPGKWPQSGCCVVGYGVERQVPAELPYCETRDGITSCISEDEPPHAYEPMDVPAIQQKSLQATLICLRRECTLEELEAVDCRAGEWSVSERAYLCYQTTWTCADKSRVLLTSEDGTKHCLKVQP